MQQPEKLTATLQLADRTLSSIASLGPSLLALRLALKSQLHVNGWASVPLEDIRGKLYFVKDSAHMVALHCPTGIDGVLVGGAEDGASFPVEGHRPALTVGMISSTNPDDHFACDCYACAGCSAADEDEWTCWMLAGMSHSDEAGWRWAYIPASSYGITRPQQQMHDAGTAHSRCALCRLENWMRKTSKARLPASIKPTDATLHIERAPHAETFCTACKVGLEIGTTCEDRSIRGTMR